jgi:hypothetical protein
LPDQFRNNYFNDCSKIGGICIDSTYDKNVELFNEIIEKEIKQEIRWSKIMNIGFIIEMVLLVIITIIILIKIFNDFYYLNDYVFFHHSF